MADSGRVAPPLPANRLLLFAINGTNSRRSGWVCEGRRRAQSENQIAPLSMLNCLFSLLPLLSAPTIYFTTCVEIKMIVELMQPRESNYAAIIPLGCGLIELVIWPRNASGGGGCSGPQPSIRSPHIKSFPWNSLLKLVLIYDCFESLLWVFFWTFETSGGFWGAFLPRIDSFCRFRRLME